MKASIQAVRAITGVYFQKLITTGAVVGGILLVLFWVLITWLTAGFDPLWALFYLLLVPLTTVSIVIYILLLKLGKNLMPRALTKSEKKRVTCLGEKVFNTAETAATPWPYHLVMISKDVLRGKESAYVMDVISNTGSLRDEFLRIRRFFTQ